MTELKTLREFDNTCEIKGYESWVSPQVLKAEAVKWVKEFRKRMDKDGASIPSDEGFKHFFNLTEEDLNKSQEEK